MSDNDTIEFNIGDLKKNAEKILKQPKYQWLIVGIIFAIVLFMSADIRASNWHLLEDQTTGGKIPLALDPFYFLRLAEIIVEEGGLDDVDEGRYPAAKVGYASELTPFAIAFLYKISRNFGDYTVAEVGVFSPVIFYIIALIFFFLLTYLLTGSKINALISSTFLAFIPSFLYRTMAGFSDHEAIGIMAFMIAMASFVYSIKRLDTDKKLLNAAIVGAVTGIATTFTIAAWGGVSKFIFMIFPTTFFVIWILKMREEKSYLERGAIFYWTWIISSIIVAPLFRESMRSVLFGAMMSSTGLVSLFVAGFILVDSFLIKNSNKIKLYNNGYREGHSILGVLILGVVGLIAIGRDIPGVVVSIWNKIFHPWGTERTSLTVAENSQPFLVDWIAQSGVILFWMFIGGMILIGFKFARGIKNPTRRIGFAVFWGVLVFGSLFSRISSSSIMNGTNFISQVIYVGSIFAALLYFARVYYLGEMKLESTTIFMGFWMFFVLLSGRSAQRIFFALAPFVCFTAGFFIMEVWGYLKENKDNALKPALAIILVIAVLLGAYSVYTFEAGISGQAAATGPSAHSQWQGAMSWARDNTPEGSIFVHWWDYGYWVEYLGERPAVTDGGHAVGYWDHLIGRYVLTTPNPDAAYSFMKAHDVSYLLIDQTDLGKYPAYSRIGSGPAGTDRYSAIPVMALDPRQTQETSNGSIMVYSGGMFVDEDITYVDSNGVTIFLPAQNAAIAGILWRTIEDGGQLNFEFPIGVFQYNGQRYDLPIRYVYVNGELIDFGEGIDAVFRILPSFDGSQVNPIGAGIYLSPRVSKGLFAQLYLLDDVFDNYEYMNVAHTQDDPLVASLKAQGADVGDLVYYRGFRGPIKIWEVNYPDYIIGNEEFTNTVGDFAEFDDLILRA